MKIILAPDSFKGSLSSRLVCEAMEKGIKEVIPLADIIKIPMADGGEGTVEALTTTKGQLIEVSVTDPLGRPITANFGLLSMDSTAVIEMASASGLPLLKAEERNPLKTSTFGTGQLIKAALDKKVNRIILGIGGSATNDGGVGMAKALGAKFLDANGKILAEGGENLSRLARIDLSELDRRIDNTDILVACDVTAPLTGPNGAAAVYGPQKGATPEMVKELDRGLLNLAHVVKDQLGIEINNLVGAGAAGGLGGGLVAFLKAKLASGVDLVLEAVKFKEKLYQANLVFTGEGRIDDQSFFGKTISGVAKTAKEMKIPVIAVTGALAGDYHNLYQMGIIGVTPIVAGPITLEEAIRNSFELITDAVNRSIRLYLAGMAAR